MEIRINNGERIELPPDFKLSVTLNNPMLSEQGSMSLPVVLPDTDNNRRTFGFLHRIDHRYKVKRMYNTTIDVGIWQKPALLRTTGTDKGIVGAFYLNESEIYARMKDVDLSQAFNIVRPASDFYVAGSFDTPLDMMIKYMELVMFDNIQDDFYLFPVATNSYQSTIKDRAGDESTHTFHQVLNENMTSVDNLDPELYDIDMFGISYNKLASRVARKIYDDEGILEIPKGYGITPFLKKNYILRRIFEYLGYELKESIFDTDPEMQKMVELNNTADAILKVINNEITGEKSTGGLDYSHLVPTGTINDYLETVRADFGCDFFISPDHKSVEVRFWNDLLNLNSDTFIPLDDKLSGKYKPQYSDPVLIKLTNKRSLNDASVNFDTIQKFQNNFGALGYRKDLTLLVSEVVPDGFYLIQCYGDIYERYISPKTGFQTWRYHSKYLFDHYYEKQEDDQYEEHNSDREYTPVVRAAIRYSDGTVVGEGIIGHYWDTETLLYVGERRFMNTVIEAVTTNESGTETVEIKKGDVTECPVMTAFYRGWKNTDGKINDTYKERVYGNYIMYDNQGNEIEGGFNLIFGGNAGLYQKFWMKYAEVIRNSFNQVQIPLNLGILDLVDFRFDNVYMIDGQPLLPENIEYSIDHNNNVIVNQAMFRTIRLYLDRDS